MQRESDQRGRIEQELTDRLQRDIQEKTDMKGQSSEHLFQMKRQLMEVEQERKLLEDRLENSKSVAHGNGEI